MESPSTKLYTYEKYFHGSIRQYNNKIGCRNYYSKSHGKEDPLGYSIYVLNEFVFSKKNIEWTLYGPFKFKDNRARFEVRTPHYLSLNVLWVNTSENNIIIRLRFCYEIASEQRWINKPLQTSLNDNEVDILFYLVNFLKEVITIQKIYRYTSKPDTIKNAWERLHYGA